MKLHDVPPLKISARNYKRGRISGSTLQGRYCPDRGPVRLNAPDLIYGLFATSAAADYPESAHDAPLI